MVNQWYAACVRRFLVTGLALGMLRCGTPAGPAATLLPLDDGGTAQEATSDAGSDAGALATPDSGVVDGGAGDAGQTDAGQTDAGTNAGQIDAGTWRTSLANCWTDATCPRVLSIAHGGAWTSSVPYDSNAALTAAYALGVDGVKIDVRVTADNVPVIAHSSPIELYESIDCYNKVIENMTAAQVTGCHRVPSTSEKFQRLDDVLNTLRGKMVVQLCVKKPTDYARTIAELHALGAEDFAFIEINTQDLPTLIPSLPGWQTVWYLVNVGTTLGDVDTILALNNPRAFMIEIDPTVQLGTTVSAKLHPAGKRSFTYDNAASPSVAELKAHFDQGFEAVSAQNASNLVQARQQANQARGVSPP